MRHAPASLVLIASLFGCSSEVGGTNGGQQVVVVAVKISRDRTLTVCPVVTGISALGLETMTGHEVAVEGGASSPADWYSWSAEGGSFEEPESETSLFHCAQAGIQTLTFVATKYGCKESSATVDVECGEL